MSRYLSWAFKIAGLYLLILIAYFLFSLASTKYESLAFYERKINPSTFLFWQNGKLFSSPPLFSNSMIDTKGQLSSRELDGLEDVDIWVLLLNGLEDIHNVKFATQLGVDVERIANSNPEIWNFIRKVSLNLRMHVIPVHVVNKRILILDGKFLRENYKEECIEELVYGSMIGQRDKKLWKRCKKT